MVSVECYVSAVFYAFADEKRRSLLKFCCYVTTIRIIHSFLNVTSLRKSIKAGFRGELHFSHWEVAVTIQLIVLGPESQLSSPLSKKF